MVGKIQTLEKVIGALIHPPTYSLIWLSFSDLKYQGLILSYCILFSR